MPAIRAVFFDLGGTLFHHLPGRFTEQNLLETLASCATDGTTAAIAELDPQTAIRIYRQHRRQAELEGQYQAFFVHRHMVAEALRRTLSDLGLVSSSAASQFCNAQRDSVTAHLQLRTDTVSTLLQLRDLRLATGIVSNIDDDYIVPLLARTELATHFDFWISSERARSCKPHVGIYQQALAQIGHAAAEVLFVGDSQTNDVLGAQRLGMQTALLTADLDKPWPIGADYYISELAELINIVSEQLQSVPVR